MVTLSIINYHEQKKYKSKSGVSYTVEANWAFHSKETTFTLPYGVTDQVSNNKQNDKCRESEVAKRCRQCCLTWQSTPHL